MVRLRVSLGLLLLATFVSALGYEDRMKEKVGSPQMHWLDDENLLLTKGDAHEVINLKTFKREALPHRGKIVKRYAHSQSMNKRAAVNDGMILAQTIELPNPTRNPDYVSIAVDITRNNVTIQHVGAMGVANESLKIFNWGPNETDFVFHEDGLLFYDTVHDDGKNTALVISPPDRERYHGLFDWVYHEEIMNRRTEAAVWWSPSGDIIAFASREVSHRTSYVMTSYMRDRQYPIFSDLPYPKVGEEVATYTIFMWNNRTRADAKELTVQLDHSKFYYLFGASWIELHGKEMLLVAWASRFQNEIDLTLCDYDHGACNKISETLKYPDKMWAQPEDYQQVPYSSSEGAFYLVLPHEHGDNHYQHIAKVIVTGSWPEYSINAEFLNFGSEDMWDVDFNHPRRVDEMKKLIYFMAYAPKPREHHLFSLSTDPSNRTGPICVTCADAYTGPCSYQENAAMNAEMQIAVFSCNGPMSDARIYAVAIDQGRQQSYELITLKKTNPPAPFVEIVSVPLGEGLSAQVRIQYPAGFNPRTARPSSLAAHLNVYGGPDTHRVTDEYTDEFFEIGDRMAAVIQIDARGQGGRGWKYKSPVYGQLGIFEIQDQITVLSYLLKSRSYFDASRTTVFGWSYGGFATLHIVEQAPKGFFKCAGSVAPVTNFYYYDATYTERYMGTIDRKAYIPSDASLRHLGNFNATRLMLVHGLADDNVHFQNSAIFMEALHQANVDFQPMVYPNENHSMGKGKDHLKRKMRKFFSECHTQ